MSISYDHATIYAQIPCTQRKMMRLPGLFQQAGGHEPLNYKIYSSTLTILFVYMQLDLGSLRQISHLSGNVLLQVP
jgi:hypothetical protein